MSLKNDPEKVINTLEKIRAKLNRGWCQGEYAQDKNDKWVEMTSPKATKFCLVGAIFTILNPASVKPENFKRPLLDLICEEIRKSCHQMYPGQKPQALISYNEMCFKTQQDALDVLNMTLQRIRESQP